MPALRKRKRCVVNDDAEYLPPCVKKQRRIRRIRSLQGIMELPLEIVCLIFSYLPGSDILNLAMSSRAIRRVVNAGRLWEQGISNTTPDLPPRLDGLTPARYVWLMFGKHCQVHIHFSNYVVLKNYRTVETGQDSVKLCFTGVSVTSVSESIDTFLPPLLKRTSY
ncbi:hypothetical protein BDZ89DRAFT_1143463 [Hymenopellis radicata]|nr:hypothetical protein BDZ89DRAFT_1143463 [Hymenopellis radicata]